MNFRLSTVDNHDTLPVPKKRLQITGILSDILIPGKPAVYLYHGQLIRTTAVESILEVAPYHVCFETKEAIYTLTYRNIAVSGTMTA